jgi:hypothetical protein
MLRVCEFIVTLRTRQKQMVKNTQFLNSMVCPFCRTETGECTTKDVASMGQNVVCVAGADRT